MRLAEKKREQVIDVLGERLAFERQLVRLYDRVVEALRPSSDAGVRDLLVGVQRHRAEEEEHARWLEDQIQALGGVERTGGDLARLVTRESRGIQDVVENDVTDLTHLLHALLAAEAVDHAGWDLLLHLASDVRDPETQRELERRVREEEAHLAFVRDAIQRFAVREVFGDVYAEEHADDLAPSLPP